MSFLSSVRLLFFKDGDSVSYCPVKRFCPSRSEEFYGTYSLESLSKRAYFVRTHSPSSARKNARKTPLESGITL